MPREMKLVRGNCACCDKSQIFEINEYNPIFFEKQLTLSQYLDYIYINVNVCPDCGYVNDNLADDIGEKSRDYVDSNSYQKILNNGFMNEFKDISPEHYRLLRGGIFDALVKLYDINNIEDFKYVKILNTVYNIKSSIRSKYFEDYSDSSDDSLSEEYDDLIKKLTKELQKIAETSVKILMNFTVNNPYDAIFSAQWLARIEKFKAAKQLIREVQIQYEFDNELTSFIQEFLSEIEKV